MDWIFEHSKFIQISNFKFLNHTRICTEATQKFSEFLELSWISYKFPKIQYYSQIQKTKISTVLLLPAHWQTDPTRQRQWTRHGGAASSGQQNAPVVTLRWDGLLLHDLHQVAHLSQASEQKRAHRMELDAGHGGSDPTTVDVDMATVQ